MERASAAVLLALLLLDVLATCKAIPGRGVNTLLVSTLEVAPLLSALLAPVVVLGAVGSVRREHGAGVDAPGVSLQLLLSPGAQVIAPWRIRGAVVDVAITLKFVRFASSPLAWTVGTGTGYSDLPARAVGRHFALVIVVARTVSGVLSKDGSDESC